MAAGYIGRLSVDAPSLHLARVIYDGYSITVIDGQPTGLEAGVGRALRIRTNLNSAALPTSVVKMIPVPLPVGASPQAAARKLALCATNFASYVSPYSFPRRLLGSKMAEGAFNGNSYLAALLRKVMGRVPHVHVPGYQVPGWESPMPLHYFKGEAIR